MCRPVQVKALEAAREAKAREAARQAERDRARAAAVERQAAAAERARAPPPAAATAAPAPHTVATAEEVAPPAAPAASMRTAVAPADSEARGASCLADGVASTMAAAAEPASALGSVRAKAAFFQMKASHLREASAARRRRSGPCHTRRAACPCIN